VIDFLLGLLLIAVAALFAMNLRLAMRLRQVEQRLASGAAFAPRAAPADAAERAGEAQPAPAQPASLPALFETLIGGRLLIWVGGIALVVAAVFLIRFTIDIGLIGPELRMAAAFLFGLILLGLGEWARGARRLADDPRIAQALVGAGLAVLYASVYGSYLLYGFIGINTASVLMLAITALALGLSLRHGIGTAALGLIGGFLTPWLVGDPDAGALPLLAYLALLDVAVFAIAWRRRWGWLAGVAVLASFAWTGFLLFGPAPDAIAGGWFAVVLGIVAAMLRPAGTSLTWIQPIGIAAVQVTILAARDDVGTLGWLAYATVAVASVVVTRIKGHPPFVAMLVLLLGLLLLPVRNLLFDASGLVSAAIGMTLLFGVAAAGIAMERKSGWWAALACFGFAGPVLALRWVMPDLMTAQAWGALQALIALGPVALVFVRQAERGGAAVDFLSLLPAGLAATMLSLAAFDLVPRDMLSIAWLVLAILFIAAGMGLKNFPLRIAGLGLLTVTVLKLFLIDAAALEGVLRILSFFGLGASLIVLGRFYGTLLRREATSG
jgi:uncharacterized membrane protein